MQTCVIQCSLPNFPSFRSKCSPDCATPSERGCRRQNHAHLSEISSVHGVPHRSSIITSVRVPVDNVYCCCCVEGSLQLYSLGLMSFSGTICGEGNGCSSPIEIYDYTCICVCACVFVRWRRTMEVLVPRNRWPTCGPGAWEERRPSSCSTSSASWNTASNPRRITCEPRPLHTDPTHTAMIHPYLLTSHRAKSVLNLEERHF